ncbi:hypothetical protein COU96_00810 [Candidatus Shapirobacteria bacterium CG10_big_fil_rev_8_21_14_0_10_38_14]|uniref:Uncharacterized protein n=1 Tax=Candidatus Shapirobacteria bacterium CG10_big_fil_rev_8_21_14_0_10_38_14 TaxID=1974483 RepID=A0A2M8L5X8_9BACT|nr:MAG: hypothetical protein COU96_00810 [Candidatus Shapirobacteria bacterium CG10_big_fil_rev_8_21_14_0_10_38_14]
MENLENPFSEESRIKEKKPFSFRKWQSGLWYVSEQLGELTRPEDKTNFYPGLYFDFLGASMDFFRLWDKSDGLKQIEQEIYHGKPVHNPEAEKITKQLVNFQPFKGLKVLEIGGPFAQTLHFLGAKKAVCIDPQIDKWPYKPKKAGYKAISERFDPKDYKEQIGEENFDLVFSRQLLAAFSGLETSKLREKFSSDDKLSQVFLTAFAQLTRPGGLSIHNGDLVEQSSKFYKKINLKLLARVETGNQQTFIFRKK